MFAPVARRLAFTNAIVIAIVVAVVGALGFSAVRYRLDQQARDALAQRALAAGVDWTPELASGELPAIAVPQPATPSPSKDHEDSPADDLIESGDTILLAYDRTGALVANPRGLVVANLPLSSNVAEALAGKTTSQRITPTKGEHFDLYTAPLRDNGAIVGVIQAIQGSGEHDRAVQLLWLAILGSAGLGMLLAAPAGLYLARRAMRPISRAFEQQQAFVADAAHELRTPLAVLRANAELIERLPDISREELTSEIGGIVGEVDEMSRLVSDLLDLARADAGRLIVNAAPANLGRAVCETVTSMTALAEAGGLALSCRAQESVIAKIDRERIRQLTRTLVDNAISYTARGGRIDVSVERRADLAIIEVRDTGVGIRPEDQPHVFRRFYRADDARARSNGGAGLGLSIADAVVAAHHGRISLTSAPDQGTTIRVHLPISAEPAA